MINEFPVCLELKITTHLRKLHGRKYPNNFHPFCTESLVWFLTNFLPKMPKACLRPKLDNLKNVAPVQN